MTLRPLTPSDIPALAEALAGIDPWRTLASTPAGLAGYLGREDAALSRMVADRDGRAVAIVTLRQPWLRGPYMEMVAVLPEAQGSGIGRRLVEWAASGHASGANLWACVSSFNDRARGFYARMGFAEVAPLPDLAKDGFDEILIRKRL